MSKLKAHAHLLRGLSSLTLYMLVTAVHLISKA